MYLNMYLHEKLPFTMSVAFLSESGKESAAKEAENTTSRMA